MRKIIIATLLLILMSCTAFAGEGSEQEPGSEEGQTFDSEFDIEKVGMTLEQTECYKTGSAITPVPELTYGEAALDKDAYPYEVSYQSNIGVGTATVTVVFSENLFPEGTPDENRSKSVNFEILPAKPQIPAIAGVASSRPNVTVKWNKVSCTGYELQVSLNSSFSGASVYKQEATAKTMANMLDSRVYYFRVRAYNTEGGKTTYGDWSTYSSKVYTTGEVGNRFVLNGAYVYNRTVKSGENYYYYDASGIKRGCSKTMWNKVRKTKSKTKYLIAVDCTQNRVCVYKGKKNKWKLKYYWKCSTGKKQTPTIKGKFKVCGKVSHFGESKGYSVWYATRIKYEYYFHSVLYKPYSKTAIKNGKLGQNISHGCIRLQMANAKWIYKNCKKKTTIIIY